MNDYSNHVCDFQNVAGWSILLCQTLYPNIIELLIATEQCLFFFFLFLFLPVRVNVRILRHRLIGYSSIKFLSNAAVGKVQFNTAIPQNVLLILFAMKRLVAGNWLAGSSCSAYLGHANLHTAFGSTVRTYVHVCVRMMLVRDRHAWGQLK